MHSSSLSDSKATYQNIFHDLPVPMWVYDCATQVFLAVNKAAVAIYGYSQDEFLRMTLPTLRLPDNATIEPREPGAYFVGGSPTVYERHRKKDGSIILVKTIAHEVTFAGSRARCLLAREISAQAGADTSLDESEERFKIVARATNDALWDWDLVSDIVWWNDGLGTSLGYKLGESPAISDDWADRIHPEDRERALASITQAIASGQPIWHDEYRIRRHDGSYAHVLDRGYVFHNRAGQPVRMIGGMIDISKKKQLEAQYLRAQRMESIGLFSGGIAHDLNNMLTPVLMSVSLLKELTADAHSLQLLEGIEKSTRRGATLVQQVLSFASGTERRPLPVNLGNLVTDVASIAKETFPPSIQISTNIAPDLWQVTGDETQLHQVVLNLAINARDAMPYGGTLIFTAKNFVIDDAYATANREAKPGPHVLLDVNDSGTGIPVEIRDRIFEAFFTTKEPGKGTGLGLSNVMKIVKYHGGSISVCSEPSHGTSFKILLPIDKKQLASEDESIRRELWHGRGEFVLLVDEVASVLAITHQTLEAYGYRVLTARSVAQAVELYNQRATEIPVVLVDAAMHGTDNISAPDAIRCINPAAKIIVACGLGAKELDAPQNESPAIRHILRKPYSTEDLLEKLRLVLAPLS